MSYAIKIDVNNDLVISHKLNWNDANDLDVIQKSLNVESADVQSLTASIDAWVDDNGALKKGNYLIGINVGGVEYKFAGKILLLGLDADTGKTRGLNDKEVQWINQYVQLWIKPVGYIN